VAEPLPDQGVRSGEGFDFLSEGVIVAAREEVVLLRRRELGDRYPKPVFFRMYQR
jgi:hypothetical protein